MERPRCPVHGLLIGDAGCLRCRRELEATRPRRTSMLALVVGVLALALVGMSVVRVVSMLDRQGLSGVFDRRRAAPPSVPAAHATAPAPSPAGAAGPGDSREARIAAEMKSIPVTLYSADYCPWCRKAKAHMDSRGIAYTELHVDKNPAAKREMARIGGRGIPTFDIEGEVRSGYDPAWVERTLRAHAERRIAGH